MTVLKKHSLLFLIASAATSATAFTSLFMTPQMPASLQQSPFYKEVLPVSPPLEHIPPHTNASLEKKVLQEKQAVTLEENDEKHETTNELPLLTDDDSTLTPEEEIGEWQAPLEEDESPQELIDEQQSTCEKLDTTLEEDKRDHMIAEEIQHTAAPHSDSAQVNEPENQPTSQSFPVYQSMPFTEMFNTPDSEEFQTAMDDALESFGITPEQAQEAMENATEEDIRQGMELAAKIIHDIETERYLAQQQAPAEKNNGLKP